MKKKVIIIGGGVAGLSAGIHAQQYGFESVIYERHSIVGGQCTGWERKGYHIDGCIHWLTGTREGSELNDLWKNVGALNDVEIIQPDRLATYESNGFQIPLWMDIDRFERDLLELSPEDEKQIKEMVSDIRLCQNTKTPARLPVDMLPLRKIFKLLKESKSINDVIKRTGKISAQEYAKRFRHPALRNMFAMTAPDNYSAAIFLFSMGGFSSGDGAIPKGGSRAMALRMERRYIDLGGKVVNKVNAEEIITDNKLAKAVRLSDGTINKADYVICACDTKTTFDKLLKGKFKDKKFEMRYNNSVDYPLPTSVQVAIGMQEDLSDYPCAISFLVEPFRVGVTEQKALSLTNYSYEPIFAPEGCTTVISCINQTDKDYFYWEELYRDKKAYNMEKYRIAADVVERILMRYPELEGKATVLDVATPMTYERYTGAYHGAWMSFMMTPKFKFMSHSGKIKGLKNCFLAGQWLSPPGGLPIAVTTGKFAVQRIAKKVKILK